MDSVAKLITAFAALLNAVAWPIAITTLFLIFRKQIHLAFERVPALLDRLRKMKVAGLEAELDRVAKVSVDDTENPSGAVTVEQVRAAARIEARTSETGVQPLLEEFDRLCLEYDTLRRAMPASRERTQAMTRIIVKMRTLGQSLSNHIDLYKSSGSAGSRLAAVAMMQMVPGLADLRWLLERFRTEQPFVFYHAALALTNAANVASGPDRQAVVQIAREALQVVTGFPGQPDAGTIAVLQALTKTSDS